jgi:hypothetical protein
MIEAALADHRPEAERYVAETFGLESPAEPERPAPVYTWGGCAEHPQAKAVESEGKVWCAFPGCTARAVLR